MKHFVSVQTVRVFHICRITDIASVMAASIAARHINKQGKDI